jgi:hypothetical protein
MDIQKKVDLDEGIGLINVEEYIEQEDGSAIIKFEATPKARELLVAQGLIRLIEKTIDDTLVDLEETEEGGTDETGD